jgi:hypothetical protein
MFEHHQRSMMDVLNLALAYFGLDWPKGNKKTRRCRRVFVMPLHQSSRLGAFNTSALKLRRT